MQVVTSMQLRFDSTFSLRASLDPFQPQDSAGNTRFENPDVNTPFFANSMVATNAHTTMSCASAIENPWPCVKAVDQGKGLTI